jgi:hypothetical protein
VPINISRYLNKTVSVSIPVLFEDGKCRPYTLLGAELNGLWLHSAELTNRLLADDQHDLAALAPIVFVPFAQIAGVLVASGMPASVTQAQPQGAAAATTPAASRKEEPSPAAGSPQSKKK